MSEKKKNQTKKGYRDEQYVLLQDKKEKSNGYDNRNEDFKTIIYMRGVTGNAYQMVMTWAPPMVS